MIAFTKRLREPIMRGEITCSVRIWRKCHVKVGGRYPLGPGHIVVSEIKEITLKQVTPALARRSGFADVKDLLLVAKHGAGENIYLIDFEYEESLHELPLVEPAKVKRAPAKKSSTSRPKR